jgi:hypothetical protein
VLKLECIYCSLLRHITQLKSRLTTISSHLDRSCHQASETSSVTFDGVELGVRECWRRWRRWRRLRRSRELTGCYLSRSISVSEWNGDLGQLDVVVDEARWRFSAMNANGTA